VAQYEETLPYREAARLKEIRMQRNNLAFDVKAWRNIPSDETFVAWTLFLKELIDKCI
jgi:hypothetical protein